MVCSTYKNGMLMKSNKLLLLQELPATSKAQDIFNVLSPYLETKNLCQHRIDGASSIDCMLMRRKHENSSFVIMYYFVFWYWVLNSGPTTLHQLFFVKGFIFCFWFGLVWFFQDRVSQTICQGLASNCDPPDLCLLSS
jgi:hypothetical protein